MAFEELYNLFGGEYAKKTHFVHVTVSSGELQAEYQALHPR